jgi:TolB-like protein
MPDIFLSYTREDQQTAQRFAEAFESQGFSVWWDVTLRSGEAYDQVTEEALRTAKAVVVLWSKKSVTSRWVRAEATLADRNRTLVPARIEACDLPIMFELTQTADLSRWKGEASDPAWRAFLADARRFMEAGAVREPSTQAPQASKPPRPGSRPSIAVLPFINRSGVEADDIFADGMVEDVTAALSYNPWLKVVAASTTATYRKGARDLRQIGRDLAVRYLLEGNVRRVGDDLRVTAQLVEAEDGDILWMQKFDRPLSELAALQEDLVTEVAACLGVEVQRAEMGHALRKPGDISAWEAYLRAVAYYSRLSRPGFEASVAEAKRAVEIDPSYGLAFAMLALAQSQASLFRDGDGAKLAEEISENIWRAHALDPDDPTVLVGAAAALAVLRKPRDALPFAERAVALNRNIDYAHMTLGIILVQLGRLGDGLAELDTTDRLGPNSIWGSNSFIWRSIAHSQKGDLDQAVAAADEAVRLLVSPHAWVQSMVCLARSDDWDRARDVLRRLRDADPELTCAHVENLVRYFYCGSTAVDDYAAIPRTIWNEPASAPRSG